MTPDDLAALASPARIGRLVCLFDAPVRPQPKERPRVYGGRGVTPERTREFEAAIAVYARQAMKGQPPTHEPVRVIILAEQRDRRRADADNVAKSILDGMSSIRASKRHAGRVGPVYLDDAQVHELRVRLVRGADRDRVTVLVEELAP